MANLYAKIQRGDIYFLKPLPVPGFINHEQQSEKGRPVVIISNDTGNHYSPNVIVVFMTSTIKSRPLPTQFYWEEPTKRICAGTVICETIYTFSKERLANYMCSLDEAGMKKLDQALAISVGLAPVPGSIIENQKESPKTIETPVESEEEKMEEKPAEKQEVDLLAVVAQSVQDMIEQPAILQIDVDEYHRMEGEVRILQSLYRDLMNRYVRELRKQGKGQADF